jgi:ERCC4-type nuclease
MEIEIDCREAKLIAALQVYPITIVSKALDVGDICIKHNNSIAVVIERKTTNDLASSIVDGRYKDQK